MTINEKINEIYSKIKFSEEIFPLRILADAGHKSYLKKCTDSVVIDGLWLEFGVYRGRTICNISENTEKIVYGFDSFEGLHEEWDKNNPKGIYTLNGVIPEGAIDGEDSQSPYRMKPWPKNVKLIKGFFEETLPKFLEENKEDIAFLHIDSDLYSSCKTILNLLNGRIKENTIIAFDEMIGYEKFREHEIKAFAEFLLETGFDYEVLYFQNPDNYGQVCIKIKK